MNELIITTHAVYKPQDSERETQRERETDRQTDRQTETERDRQTDRQRLSDHVTNSTNIYTHAECLNKETHKAPCD